MHGPHQRAPRYANDPSSEFDFGHHYVDEKKDVFDRKHAHYYEDKYSYKHGREELEWPVSHHEFRHQPTLHDAQYHVREELTWPESEDTAHDVETYDPFDEHSPANDKDFASWDSRDHEKWYEVDHTGALRHREKELYGTHYGGHEDAHSLPPWTYDSSGELHQDIGTDGHNKHYERYYHPEHL